MNMRRYMMHLWNFAPSYALWRQDKIISIVQRSWGPQFWFSKEDPVKHTQGMEGETSITSNNG
jgi:hypothetical protein